MSKFHASIRDLLEDVHAFLTKSIQNEILTSSSLTHKERLLSRLKCLQNDYPQLLLQFNETEVKTDSKRCSASSPLPYVDMNGGSPYKIPFFAPNADKENYDLCGPTERCDSLENQSTTGSEEYGSDDAKFIPDVAASDLFSCEKCGYLDKKKRETIKGWLNPFQRRWCAIKNGVLYYFEKTTDRKQKGSIILAGYEARTLPDDSKEGKKYNNCFELVCPGKRTYQFSAASDNDLQQWISAVEKYSRISNSGGRLSIRDSQSLSSSPQTTQPTLDPHSSEDIYETVDEDMINDPLSTNDKAVENKPESTIIADSNNQDIFNYSDWYVGLWDCTANDYSELSFHRGDLIHVVSKDFDTFSWWVGELNGKVGFVPKTYLMEAYESC
ncbi:hypothetical protein JTE90_019579 [Oedothorax gibbosus]|uniref:Src kinase-associated phosphoprotein 2 n=1 Tax=Oedothorax gibbosus TaxID=931172 RepID=A0AAV6V479_9ARAC|nr:hypothetical protein JTE90_019579 [Oedothorax gibbosus]